MTTFAIQRTPREIWGICYCCAWRFPAPGAAARLLLGTAAQESAFRWRRQISFDTPPLRERLIGAFSLWQLEPASITTSVERLRARPALRERADWYLDPWGISTAWITGASTLELVRLLMQPEGDALGCLLARLHYLRVADPIPEAVEDQARYWKQHYNTPLGRGTTGQYLASWRTLCEPVLRPEEEEQ